MIKKLLHNLGLAKLSELNQTREEFFYLMDCIRAEGFSIFRNQNDGSYRLKENEDISETEKELLRMR